jgi:L-2-hydroxyglutarate oxidase
VPARGGVADLVVIGGGVVGLALADAWLASNPVDSVVVYDKENQLAAHASGRNSGVLHAGFYYAPDSLKAQLTRDGNRMLKEFCIESGVPLRETGKVVVTTDEKQLPALTTLLERGRANGVALELIDEGGLAELEPLARTVGNALWSPNTAVASPARVVEALAARVRARGGRVVLGNSVTGAGPGWVMSLLEGRVSTGHVINAAGLYADTVAHWFGFGADYRMLPFKGLYWYGNWEPGRLQRHVYPVPDPRNPFLGVHLTVTVDGRAKIGPTAIPALWREDYGGTAGLRGNELWDVVRTYPKFLTSKHHDVPGLLRAELPKYSRSYLVNQAAALVPSVRPADFTERGKPGVRAQLLHMPSGKLEMDFVVEGDARSTHILNAVSPAWTSSLAVADYVVERITSN